MTRRTFAAAAALESYRRNLALVLERLDAIRAAVEEDAASAGQADAHGLGPSWTDAEELARLAAELKDPADRLTGRGEYAPENR